MGAYHYHLAPGIRARREGFGLLFYNSKDTNLTFVRSGELLNVEVVPENQTMLIPNCNNGKGKEKIVRLINVLMEKGLVVEAQIGI